jgi:biotin carboxyl carrier protein
VVVKYFVRIGERELELELVREGQSLFAVLGERRFEVEHADVDRLGQSMLRVGPDAYAVSMEEEGERYRVSIAGEGFTVECDDERERAARALSGEKAAGGGLVESVMPGIVRAVMVAEGDVVAPDTTLLILEAMKMQNEIKAGANGTVAKIHVAVGAAVGAGAKLVEIKPPES